MIRRPPRSTQGVSSAASDVYKRQHPSHYTAAPRSQSRGTPTSVIDSHEQSTACVSYTTYPGYNFQPRWQPATLAAVERPLVDPPSGHTTHSQNPPQHYSLTPKIHPSHYTAAPRSQSRGTPTPVIDSRRESGGNPSTQDTSANSTAGGKHRHWIPFVFGFIKTSLDLSVYT